MKASQDMVGPTRKIARFVSELRYEAIPEVVRHRMKLLILDSFGCALYGAGLPWSGILQERLSHIDQTRQCSVWGTNLKLSSPHAALVNGTQVQGFEVDDVHRAGVLHVGAVVLPALVSIVESGRGMSGREFLTAAVAGYEIGPRVGLCMGPEHIGQGWHSGATLGVFSAAAGAARGLGLDEERTVHALGVAGTQAAGLMAAQFGSMVKRMHAGRSSQSGLYGAILAEAGFTGITDVLENEYGGFCSTFSRSTDRFDLAKLTEGLGESWQSMGVALKFYSCVGSNHTTLDVLRELRAEHGFGPEDVEAIVVHGSRVTVDHVGWRYAPQGLTSAQLNLPYCVATMLIEGDCFIDQFREDRLEDRGRMALADRVSVVEDPSITAKGAKFRHSVRVDVALRDGRNLAGAADVPRGGDAKFASDEDVVDKYRKLARSRFDESKADALCEAVLGLETLPDVRVLPELLAL